MFQMYHHLDVSEVDNNTDLLLINLLIVKALIYLSLPKSHAHFYFE